MFVKGFYFWATAIWGCSNQIGFEEFLNAVGWPPADSLGCQGLLQPLSCEGPGLSRRWAHCQHGHDRSFVCLFLLNMRVFQCRSVRICDNHSIIIEIWLNNSQSSICKSPIIPHFHWLTSNSLCILPTEGGWLWQPWPMPLSTDSRHGTWCHWSHNLGLKSKDQGEFWLWLYHPVI
jgi:hypothetical protein